MVVAADGEVDVLIKGPQVDEFVMFPELCRADKIRRQFVTRL